MKSSIGRSFPSLAECQDVQMIPPHLGTRANFQLPFAIFLGYLHSRGNPASL